MAMKEQGYEETISTGKGIYLKQPKEEAKKILESWENTVWTERWH